MLRFFCVWALCVSGLGFVVASIDICVAHTGLYLSTEHDNASGSLSVALSLSLSLPLSLSLSGSHSPCLCLCRSLALSLSCSVSLFHFLYFLLSLFLSFFLSRSLSLCALSLCLAFSLSVFLSPSLPTHRPICCCNGAYHTDRHTSTNANTPPYGPTHRQRKKDFFITNSRTDF